MIDRNAWARVAKPVFEIGDIPDSVAIDFLTNNGISRDISEKAVSNITGGRLLSLVGFAEMVNEYKQGKSNDIAHDR